MFQNLSVFQSAAGLAKHATARQSVVAQNVANVDTPGYRTKDIASFSETWRAEGSKSDLHIRRANHIPAFGSGTVYSTTEVQTASVKPNGNSVSIEAEILKSVEIERSHSRALAVYQSSLDILKTSIGRGR